MEENTQLGKYRLLKLIAAGGMGEVFLAKSEGPAGFAKTFVIKCILRHLATDPTFVDMFLNEARLAALLSHPNIVQIFELGQEEGTYFIAMEYVRGRSLKALKQKLYERRELFSPVLAARLCAQALQGLHYAHTLTDEAGAPLHVVHRDISPDNVLVSVDGQVKLVDFGIAKAANAVSTTRTGTIKGKYAYMAPEQLTGATVDGRTDVYSMGVVLYELMTGSRPYSAPTEPSLINTILTTRPTPPRERNPELPAVLGDIIMTAMEKDPSARYATAEDMAQALEEFITQSGTALTQGHIGKFVKELFGDEITQGPITSSGSRPSQVGSKVGSKPAAPVVAPLPPTAGPEAAVMPPTEVAATPVSAKTRPSTRSPPSLAEVAPLEPSGKRQGRWMIPSVAGVAVLALAAGAYFLGKHNVPEPVAPEPPTPSLAQRPAQPNPNPNPIAIPIPIPIPAPIPTPAHVAAPHRPSPAKTKPRVASKGKVSFRVNPWAEVFHGGKSLGITPMAAVFVPSGPQTFTLKNSEIGLTKKVTVTVPADGETVLKADLFQ
ncbi:MAG: serine/threonine protein kinase [Myxococcaceae bacterium]